MKFCFQFLTTNSIKRENNGGSHGKTVGEAPTLWQLAPLFQMHRAIIDEAVNGGKNENKIKPSTSLTNLNNEDHKERMSCASKQTLAIHFHQDDSLHNNSDYLKREKIRFGSYLVPVFKNNEIKIELKSDSLKPVVLGEGRYGRVTLARLQGKLCVVKHLKDEPGLDSAYKAEVKLMCRLNYTTATAKLYGIMPIGHNRDVRKIGHLVMEFIGDEFTLKTFNLEWMLRNGPNFNDERSWIRMCSSLCKKVFQLHEASIIHCDIKPNNVILKPVYQADSKVISHLIPYLIDFGLSMDPTKEQFTISRENTDPVLFKRMHPHVAPEMVDFQIPFSAQSDSYAVGYLIQLVGNLKKIQLLSEIGKMIVATPYPKRPSLFEVGRQVEAAMQTQEKMIISENIFCLKSYQPLIKSTNQQEAWKKWLKQQLKKGEK